MKKIDALLYIKSELDRASIRFPPFHSAHEGYAVLLEEVDELWDEVKKNPGKREIERIKQEAIQVAAMAARILVDLCPD